MRRAPAEDLCRERCDAKRRHGTKFIRPPNGLEVNPRGQGPRTEADAAHGVHACESRDAGRAPPFRF